MSTNNLERKVNALWGVFIFYLATQFVLELLHALGVI